MWQVGDMLEFVRKTNQFYTHGRRYRLHAIDFNAQTYIIDDDYGSKSHPWDMLVAASEFKNVNLSGVQHQPSPIPPYPQNPYAAVSSGFHTLPGGGYRVYWESSGTENSTAPTETVLFCQPKEYEGFTEKYFYCTRCDRKSDDEAFLTTSICGK